ncbi:unnamed protein product [Bursaphelenchus xylophilus]|uniref:(pine wood nematode) hypothetical protein n=1 Tax=Bursaphelenchus xylophilus TaxID=6326 RepID=A0A1I7SGK3_BURXY|nr:unnamed protein product [Bursaphelenchus xylophilus]CAG9122465.1 unnamed protein product [Bursaphelenchus xylophilus]
MLCEGKPAIRKAIKRLNELGHGGKCPGIRKKRILKTSANLEIIRKRVKQNLIVSMKKIARETGIKGTTDRRMVINVP